MNNPTHYLIFEISKFWNIGRSTFSPTRYKCLTVYRKCFIFSSIFLQCKIGCEKLSRYVRIENKKYKKLRSRKLSERKEGARNDYSWRARVRDFERCRKGEMEESGRVAVVLVCSEAVGYAVASRPTQREHEEAEETRKRNRWIERESREGIRKIDKKNKTRPLLG